MKRLILLVFFLVIARIGMTQEDFYNDYLITISGTMNPSDDASGDCGTGYYLDVIFEDETRVNLVPWVRVGGYGEHPVNGRLQFSTSNKIKTIYVWTSFKYTNSIGRCKGEGGDVDRYIQLNQTTTCYTNNFKFGINNNRYHFDFNVNIQPLSKKSMRMAVEANLRNNANQDYANDPSLQQDPELILDNNKFEFSYQVTTTFDDGTSEISFVGSADAYNAGALISRQRSDIYPKIKRPVSITIRTNGKVGFYKWVLANDSNGEGGGGSWWWEPQYQFYRYFSVTHNLNVSHAIPGVTSNSVTLFPGANVSDIKFTSSTFAFPLKYGPDNTNLLPYDTLNRVTVLGPSGNPSDFYHWVWSNDGTTWQDLPAKFQGKQRLSISGYDLQGEDFMNYHNSNVFIKLIIDCNGGESDVLTLSRRVSAPNIVNITPIPDRCYDKPNDGSFRITFNRPLLSNAGSQENLTILVRDLSNTNAPDQIQSVVLDATNSFTWPRRLQSDREYEVTLYDVYLGAPAFSDNKTYHYDTITLVRPTPVSTLMTSEAVHCYGGGDGKITITAIGGAGNYNYYYLKSGATDTLRLSMNGSVTSTIDMITSGSYFVHVEDGNQCGDRSGVKSILVSQPSSAVSIAYTATTNPLAYGYADGFIETIVIGGTSYADKHYDIEWYDPLNVLPSTQQENAVLSSGYQANINNLPDGSYIIKAYDAQYSLAHPDHRSGCYTESLPLRLVQPQPLLVTISEQHVVSCFGYTDGSLAAHAQGGIQQTEDLPYRYEWLADNNGALQTINQSDSIALGLRSGIYRIRITDKNNIQKLSDPFTLIQPEVLQASVATTPVSCNLGSDGTVTAVVQGGTLPYQYAWSVPGTTSTISGLPAGTYELEVSDIRGCITFSSGTIASPDFVTSSLTSYAVHCDGGGDGRIKLEAYGGSGEYHFTFGPAGARTTTDVAFGTANEHVIEFLSEGTYEVEIRDGHDCLDYGEVKTIYVSQPSPLKAQLLSITDPLGYGYTDGHIETLITGGTPYADGHYEVEWYDPVTLLPATQYVGSSRPEGYQAQLEQAGDGYYWLKAFDGAYALAHPDHRAGCIIKSDTFHVIQPPPLIVSLAQHRYVSCNGFSDGEVEARADGGAKIETGLPYQYEWFKEEGGVLTAVSQQDSIAYRLRSGHYRVKITDKNGVEKLSESFFLVEPATLQAQVATTTISCKSGEDGTAQAIVQGGTSPYRYEWSTGSSTQLIDKLIEGGYFVFVTDSRGCRTSANGRVVSPYAVNVDSVVTDPQCYGYNNGKIALTVSGGSGPYRYAWSNGSVTEDIDNLSSGVYSVEIYDNNGCRNIRRFSLSDPAALQLELGPARNLCNSQQYEADASLPDPASSYMWSGPNQFSATTARVTLAEEGTYAVTATDSHGCYVSDEITIRRVGVDIDAEFVVTTQAFASEEVTLLNISDPVADSVTWWVSGRSDVPIVREADVKARVVFAEEGLYTICLKTYREGCEAVFNKTVTVVGSSFEEVAVQPASDVLEFMVTPVPNQGTFTVTIALKRKASIRLRMISMANNMVVSDRQESDKDHYEVPYSVDLSAGNYLLLMESPLGSSVFKVILY